MCAFNYFNETSREVCALIVNQRSVELCLKLPHQPQNKCVPAKKKRKRIFSLRLNPRFKHLPVEWCTIRLILVYKRNESKKRRWREVGIAWRQQWTTFDTRYVLHVHEKGSTIPRRIHKKTNMKISSFKKKKGKRLEHDSDGSTLPPELMHHGAVYSNLGVCISKGKCDVLPLK